jgi:quinoprotein glucose dehydrogenase
MHSRISVRQAPLLVATAIILALMGLVLAAGGIWLVLIHGSFYYLIAGLALLAVAWLLFRRRAEALWLYAALLLATLIWAIWEVGLDFWSLAPRGDVLVPIGIWLLLPFISSHLAGRRRAAASGLGLVLIVAAVVLGVSLSSDRKAIAGALGAENANAAAGAPSPADAASD